MKTESMMPADDMASAAVELASADKVRRLGIRANADTPADAKQSRQFGAEELCVGFQLIAQVGRIGDKFQRLH